MSSPARPMTMSSSSSTTALPTTPVIGWRPWLRRTQRSGSWSLPATSALFSFSDLPLVLFYPLAAFCSAIFVGLSIVALYDKFTHGGAIPAWMPTMIVASFFGAMNAAGIAILGEYLTRILDEVRGRPVFIVDREINIPGSRSRTPQ